MLFSDCGEPAGSLLDLSSDLVCQMRGIMAQILVMESPEVRKASDLNSHPLQFCARIRLKRVASSILAALCTGTAWSDACTSFRLCSSNWWVRA